jgi:hypothetical protein
VTRAIKLAQGIKDQNHMRNATDLMDQIIFEMTKKSNNLIVFLVSDPLVKKKGTKIISLFNEREINEDV